MGLGDFETALKMREMLVKLIGNEIESQRPRLQYATVTAIDRAKRKCSVKFTGESSSISVNMGSVQPRDVGQVVRIDGLMGDRFVADVMGPVYQEAPTLNAPTLVGPTISNPTISNPTITGGDVALPGSVTTVSGSVTAGSMTDTTQRKLTLLRKASTGTNTYEVDEQLDDGATSAMSMLLLENGTEKNRLTLGVDGTLQVGPAGGPRATLNNSAVQLSSEDLNTLNQTSLYYQSTSANATSAKNYPISLAGVLEVFRAFPTGDVIMQRYTTYDSQYVFSRTYQGGAWKPWLTVAYSASYTLQSGDYQAPWAGRSGFTNIVYREGNLCTMSLQLSTTAAVGASGTVFAAGKLPSWCYPPQVRILTWADGVQTNDAYSQPNAEIASDGTLKVWAGKTGGATSSTKIFGTWHV